MQQSRGESRRARQAAVSSGKEHLQCRCTTFALPAGHGRDRRGQHEALARPKGKPCTVGGLRGGGRAPASSHALASSGQEEGTALHLNARSKRGALLLPPGLQRQRGSCQARLARPTKLRAQQLSAALPEGPSAGGAVKGTGTLKTKDKGPAVAPRAQPVSQHSLAQTPTPLKLLISSRCCWFRFPCPGLLIKITLLPLRNQPAQRKKKINKHQQEPRQNHRVNQSPVPPPPVQHRVCG